MNYEGTFAGDQGQNSGVCNRGGITHDQVFSDRQTIRSAPRCNDNSVVVNGDIYLGDAPSAPHRQQVTRTERYDSYDDRNLDSRYTVGASRYGDDYTGSSARMQELRDRDYYLNQQRQGYYDGQPQGAYYEGQQPRYGINGNQLIGAGIGGLIGMALTGGHHGRDGYYHRGNQGLGFLAGSLIGGGLAGGSGYETPIVAPQVMIGNGWGGPPPMYHYRHESPQQRYWEMQQRQRMAYNYGSYNTYNSYSSPGYSSGYDTW